MRITSRVANLSLVIGSLALSALLAEAVCRIVEWAGSEDAVYIADSRFGSIMAPNRGGADSRGFRNPGALDSADIVAIGDSMTYGYNARSDQAWPQVLGRLTRSSVYSMAIGGDGPLEYWTLAQEAVRLRPRVVILGIYLGNDLFDAARHVYRDDRYQSFRAAGIPLTSAEVKDREETFLKMLAASTIAPPAPNVFSRHLAVFRLLGGVAAGWRLEDTARQRVENHKDLLALYRHAGTTTILTPAYRLRALDLSDPVIHEGLAITERVIDAIERIVEASGAKLLVAILPTKESVAFSTAGEARDRSDYRRLVAAESEATESIAARCSTLGIPLVDLRPPLEKELAAGKQIFPVDADGHPVSDGYLVIANAIGERLRSLGWLGAK